MIVGAATQRPVILTFALFDWQVINAGDAHAHQPVLIELPVLVAIATKLIAAIIVPFVGEANHDSVLAECPNFLDQAVRVHSNTSAHATISSGASGSTSRSVA